MNMALAMPHAIPTFRAEIHRKSEQIHLVPSFIGCLPCARPVLSIGDSMVDETANSLPSQTTIQAGLEAT